MINGHTMHGEIGRFRWRRITGFTLIELLVVISIIALLMSILMPSLSKVKDMARTTVCVSQLRQYGIVFALYKGDYNGYYSMCFDEQTSDMWIDYLRPYYAMDEVLLCPSARTKEHTTNPVYHGGYPGWGDWQFGGIIEYWWIQGPKYENSGGDDTRRCSYGTNAWIHTEPMAVWGSPLLHWKRTPKGESEIPLVLDCSWFMGYPDDTNVPRSMRAYSYPASETTTNFSMINRYLLPRHEDFVGCVFADGHATKVHLEALWSLKWHKEFEPQREMEIEWVK